MLLGLYCFGKRLTVSLSGSGGTGETLSQLCTISGKTRLRGAAKPLSAGAGVRRGLSLENAC